MFQSFTARLLLIIVIVIATIILACMPSSGWPLAQSGAPEQPVIGHTITQMPPLYSAHACLIDAKSGRVLYKKEADSRAFPASLTKMMTAFVAINHAVDLQKKTVLPASLFKQLQGSDASVAGFLPDEQVRFIDLLYGTMLPSGADAASALAIAVAGSEPAFVRLMNQEAEILGMTHTHFTNSTGLHDAAHYSTAADLAILLRHALKNPTFRRLMTATRDTVPPTNRHPRGFTLQSTLRSDAEAFGVDSRIIIGGKTGYTEQAGLCLASFASIAGHDYILVTLGAAGTPRTNAHAIEDAVHVYQALRATMHA
ncbi:MAG: D-alanyl-D-alanine carboxypeptidase [Sporolactobacillus sp.]